MTPFARLEQQKAEMLASLEDWSAARLNYRPASDQWSAAQVIDHLIRTEIGILVTVRRDLSQPHPLTLRDRLGVILLRRVYRSPRRVKVPPSATQVSPAAEVDFLACLTRWEQTRNSLSVLLANAPPSANKGGVFRHPVAGWMTLPQVIDFFSDHLLHHGFQLTRLRQESDGL